MGSPVRGSGRGRRPLWGSAMNARAQMMEGRVIKLAILAVGGQGGGVLTNWIVELAESCGWRAQSTAVAGVAQRTGATIYYVEMAPETGRDPVFALAPAPGDVDILIAAEWMEAGRAVLRGFVTPDRTTLIASTHRALAVSEKIVPGDGLADGAEVADALEAAAVRVIAFDMQAPAVKAGSVISATLFGALAASGTLPFEQDAFADTIRRSGRGVEASLAAFGAGRDGVAGEAGSTPKPPAEESEPRVEGPDALVAAFGVLEERLGELPDAALPMARAGLAKVVDFQDVEYGAEYLDRIRPFAEADRLPDHALTIAAAKYVANAMAYDDVLRVADLKTRARRFERIRGELGAGERIVHLTEFMHPRAEELVSTLPAGVGGWIAARPRLMRAIDRIVNRGRRVRTDTIAGYAMLWLLAGRRRTRRGTLRHRTEMAHIDAWTGLALRHATTDQRLAVEVLATRRLIKGYSDTHARGLSKYDRVLGALPMLEGREDASDWLRRLREAALQDTEGRALDGALATVSSFAEPA